MEPAKNDAAAQKEAAAREPVATQEPATAPKADPFETWALWLKDNVEAFVVAFIIALVVRCFCLEVFKIPTGSMTPTLLGDHDEYAGEGLNPSRVTVGGDRIMVSKFMYHLFPIERFDVLVFKYPLDTSRNFIKRLVGMPNEKLLVQQGDLYYLRKEDEQRGDSTWRIARKPLRVQEAIWIPVFPSRRHARLSGAWTAEPQAAAEIGEGSVRMDAKAGHGQSTLSFGGSITDAYEAVGSGGNQRVGDLRLAATVTLSGDDTAITFRIRSAPDWVEATLPAKGKAVLAWEMDGRKKETREFDSPFADGRPHDVALLNYDGLAHLRVDGEAIAELSYRETKGTLDKAESAASLIVLSGEATIERLTLDRDIYYLSGGRGARSVLHPEETPIEIPDKCYFMMGDNSPGSKDSRLWDMKVFKLQSGEVIRADADLKANPPAIKSTADGWLVRDEFGVEHRIKREDLKSPPEQAPAEDAVFVKEELIVGKAFYVWWPLKRMKLIR